MTSALPGRQNIVQNGKNGCESATIKVLADRIGMEVIYFEAQMYDEDLLKSKTIKKLEKGSYEMTSTKKFKARTDMGLTESHYELTLFQKHSFKKILYTSYFSHIFHTVSYIVTC
jgi:hypothetical protein